MAKKQKHNAANIMLERAFFQNKWIIGASVISPKFKSKVERVRKRAKLNAVGKALDTRN